MSVSLENVSFRYGERRVLRDISFAAPPGAFVSVLGPNGVGKSTLFKCMLGILTRFTGEILLEGESVRGMSARSLAQKAAYIPQSHYPAFNYSVLDMVLMGASARVHAFSQPGKAETEEALQSLARLGIEALAHRDFTRISGGERQLVLIARALAQRSRLLIMDEPTANLDFGNQMRVLTSVRGLADAGYTVLQSTHNPEQAYLFSHQILAMREGRIIARGTPSEVLTRELILALYDIETRVESLFDDRMRVCAPEHLLFEAEKQAGAPHAIN